MELKCSFQTYAWGKQGLDSIVATLLKSDNNEIIKEKVPYAELWMGTHPNGPSTLKINNISLESYIKEKKELLGEKVLKKFGVQLPFIFKVLSIKKALSIQVHPNKSQAEKLHESNPQMYKDPNHKPELAIALTPFEALCGFRPISEIQLYLSSIPEFMAVIGENKISNLNSCKELDQPNALKACFISLMTREIEIIAEQSRKLLSRMCISDDATRDFLKADLFEKLNTDYPGDVGCFGIYLFNHIKLDAGEAIFLGPNEPHAYLFGDCIECMACSDNVIRAGLTPKMKDVETLIDMVSFESNTAQSKHFQPIQEDSKTEIFRPPVHEFAVAKITIPPGISNYEIIPRDSASILIVINGKAELNNSIILKSGTVIFIGANEKICLKIICGCHPMIMFQALVNV